MYKQISNKKDLAALIQMETFYEQLTVIVDISEVCLNSLENTSNLSRV